MMEKTIAVPAAVPPFASALATVPGETSQAEAGRGTGRPLFVPRPRRLSTGLAPAAFIVLVWMLLWAWVSVGVAAPLSRIGCPERTRPAQESSLRA